MTDSSAAQSPRPAAHSDSLANLLLACADDKLMLGHRNSDWTGLAPILEEDIAFSSIAQDEMAHAQALYELAGTLLGKTADELAFGREPKAYRCARIVEVPDEFDWGTAIARQFFCDHFDRLRLARMAESSYKPLADLAKRLVAEEQVHVQHVDAWIHHLGGGNEDSNAHLQKSLDALSPLAPLLFEKTEGHDELVAEGLYPGVDLAMYDEWKNELERVARESNLTLALEAPEPDAADARRGGHSEHFEGLLDEMCEVYRIEPGAAW